MNSAPAFSLPARPLSRPAVPPAATAPPAASRRTPRAELRRRWPVMALALCLGAALLVLDPTAARASKVGSMTASSKAYGVKAEKAANRQRIRAGRKAVNSNACLAKWAGRHAARLAKAGGGIHHQNLDPVLRDCGLSRVGENVAVGYASGTATVTQGWMNSPSHRRNLLDARYRKGEVVARRGANGRWYAVQLLGR